MYNRLTNISIWKLNHVRGINFALSNLRPSRPGSKLANWAGPLLPQPWIYAVDMELQRNERKIERALNRKNKK